MPIIVKNHTGRLKKDFIYTLQEYVSTLFVCHCFSNYTERLKTDNAKKKR